jgi:hypothetical protein
MFATVAVLLVVGASLSDANFVRKRQAGGDMIDGHEVLVSRFWADTARSANCQGAPYDTTEVDITEGMTCLTIGMLTGYYFQRAPNNATHYRRCVTDNLSCMSNANETCTTFPRALGDCFKATTKLSEGTVERNVTVWTTTTIEVFKKIRSTKRKIAVEELHLTEDCSGNNALSTKELWPDKFHPNTSDCVPDVSKKSYRAFHNSYDDTRIRVCDYAPEPQNLLLSCDSTPYICHVYSNGICTDYPFGGSFKVYVRDAPALPTVKSGAATSSLSLAALVAALVGVAAALAN